MFNRERIRNLQNELEETKKELEETKKYFIAKNQGKIAWEIAEKIETFSLGDAVWCHKVVWLDDKNLKVNSVDIPNTRNWLNDFDEFKIYQNKSKEIFLQHNINKASIDPKKNYETVETRYYKLNKKRNTLERVYFEGKKETLGKKIWG